MKRYLVIAAALFFLITLNLIWTGKAPHLGFWGYVCTLVFGTLFTAGGMMLGELFRRFAKPDIIVVDGSQSLFGQKLFWLVGPQAIGALGGFIAFQGFMKNVLGYLI